MSPAPQSQHEALFAVAHTFAERRTLAAVILECSSGPNACRKVTLDALLGQPGQSGAAL